MRLSQKTVWVVGNGGSANPLDCRPPEKFAGCLVQTMKDFWMVIGGTCCIETIAIWTVHFERGFVAGSALNLLLVGGLSSLIHSGSGRISLTR